MSYCVSVLVVHVILMYVLCPIVQLAPRPDDWTLFVKERLVKDDATYYLAVLARVLRLLPIE